MKSCNCLLNEQDDLAQMPVRGLRVADSLDIVVVYEQDGLGD